MLNFSAGPTSDRPGRRRARGLVRLRDGGPPQGHKAIGLDKPQSLLAGDRVGPMSALGGKADINSRLSDVCF
jgi:hypothetical protein